MISANTSNLGEHAGTLDVLAPLLQSIDTLDAPTRAAVRNNVAFALTMSFAASRSRVTGRFKRRKNSRLRRFPPTHASSRTAIREH
jgi:hypothetical protein